MASLSFGTFNFHDFIPAFKLFPILVYIYTKTELRGPLGEQLLQRCFHLREILMNVKKALNLGPASGQ